MATVDQRAGGTFGGRPSGAGTASRLTVAADGRRVVFLRSHALWTYEVSSGTERLVIPGPSEYATDALARSAVFPIAGRLHRADLATGEVSPVPTAGPASDPRLDPTGQRIGYLCGGELHAIDEHGTDTLLAGEPNPADGGHPCVTWGRPEPAADRHFGRDRGWWWAPAGRRVLAARVDTGGGGARRSRADGERGGRRRAEVSLHLLDLDGGWVDVHWDRETYPYLVSVCWSDHGDPLIAVLRRPQQHGLVLAVDARTGETQVHAELADPRWVEPIPGTPCHLADGRVLVGGELAHDGYDARCLFADGTLLTPPSLYVRRVVGRLPGGGEILVEGSAGEPSEQHLFRVSTSVGAGGIDARRVTTVPGWHRAVVGGGTLVIGSESLDHPSIRWTVYSGENRIGSLGTRPGAAGAAGAAGGAGGVPHPQLARVTDRRLPAGVLYPRGHVTGRRLPVLVDAGWAGGTSGGQLSLSQGVRAVRADWLPRQRWADNGFAVVVIDHRGTPGVAPSFEKVIHRRLADLALADLADALAALVGKHPDLDLDRVAIQGRGVGGWLAALAVLRRPDLFRCAVATSPIVDWARHEPAFAERYLGLPEDGAEVYQHHSLLNEPPASARLLIVDEPDGAGAELGGTLPSATLLTDPSPATVTAWLRDQLGG